MLLSYLLQLPRINWGVSPPTLFSVQTNAVAPNGEFYVSSIQFHDIALTSDMIAGIGSPDNGPAPGEPDLGWHAARALGNHGERRCQPHLVRQSVRAAGNQRPDQRRLGKFRAAFHGSRRHCWQQHDDDRRCHADTQRAEQILSPDLQAVIKIAE